MSIYTYSRNIPPPGLSKSLKIPPKGDRLPAGFKLVGLSDSCKGEVVGSRLQTSVGACGFSATCSTEGS